ncbi:NUDIX hydrolase [Streptomyces otsuchiensis]|uniref:NUDIX hydrolase n=1 Tax=Streptomyces otsuchiensis TaxID=2681388 RepID=UPI0010315526|nr:NUDIX hydrolase [Streptomyces otsuchiensis]
MSVAGVIVDDHGRALLIKRRDNGHWEPPGGVVEAGETLPDALAREVLEETGLKIDTSTAALTGVYQNMADLVVSMVFRCRAIAGQPTTGDETKALHWATRDEATTLADEAYSIRVLDALDAAPPPAIRAHDGVKLV